MDADKTETDYNSQICLETSDGKRFMIPIETAYRMNTLKVMLHDCQFINKGIYDVIPVFRVHSKELIKILAWLDKCKPDQLLAAQNATASSEDANQKLRVYQWNVWKHVFGENMKCKDVVDLINAADYLEVVDLFDYAVLVMARVIKSRTIEDMQNALGVQDPANYNKVIGCMDDELYYNDDDEDEYAVASQNGNGDDDEFDVEDGAMAMPSQSMPMTAEALNQGDVTIEDIGEDMEEDNKIHIPNKDVGDNYICLEHDIHMP